MDKDILNQYIDACELVKETEKDIRQVKKQRKSIVQGIVKGSSPEFPYTAKNFHIEGVSYSVIKNPEQLERKEQLLEERKQNAERIKLQVESWMNTIPVRMQRIIRMRVFENLSWKTIAVRMGRKATEDSVRKEYERFIEKS